MSLAELDEKHSVAEQMYTAALELRWTRRLYFECLALTGLGRTNLLVGDVGDRQSYISEAEYLALRYEFNDCLAQLQLIRASADLVPSAIDRSTNLDSAFSWYKLALQFALRYNRFLLDEVLSGRPEGTPHQPIIPTCLARGEEGRRMLAQLADWWAAGLNDTGTPRPDTISPIPEGIPLLEAERLARRREPGIGTPQQTVLEQINAALEACSS